MSCLELCDAEIVKIAEPMMDIIMLGVTRRDYKLHSTNFSVHLKGQINSEVFLSSCDKQENDWGLPGHRELRTVFRKHKSFTLVWDQHYSRTDEEVVAVATVALKGGRYFIDFFILH